MPTIIKQLIRGAPDIKVSGDEVGAFLYPALEMAPGDGYHIALSDGTLLDGIIDGLFSINTPGKCKVEIGADEVVIHGPLSWVAVFRGGGTLITAGETAEWRESVESDAHELADGSSFSAAGPLAGASDPTG